VPGVRPDVSIVSGNERWVEWDCRVNETFPKVGFRSKKRTIANTASIVDETLMNTLLP
jgi:hypothetical protein